MAKFSFGKGSSEEESIPEEVGDETITLEARTAPPPKSRRILIIAGIGVILVAGGYLANELFLKPPPAPPTPARPAVPVPPAKAPVPAAPTKEAAPAPPGPAKPPAAVETKPAPPMKVATAPPAGPEKAPPAKVPAAPAAPPAKAAAPPPAPGKATPPQKTPAAPGVTAKGAEATAGFSLQVGAMVMEENADSLKKKLDGSGFPSTIRKGTASVTKHVVTVGEPSGKPEAEELARRLNVDGFPSQLLAIGGKYTPQVGAFFSENEALDLARELQKKNYRPKNISRSASTMVFQVRHGTFDSRTAALKRREELKSKGFSPVVVRN